MGVRQQNEMAVSYCCRTGPTDNDCWIRKLGLAEVRLSLGATEKTSLRLVEVVAVMMQAGPVSKLEPYFSLLSLTFSNHL